MSSFLFIACEYELPTLYSPKLHKPDGREINVFQSEDDLYDLEIIPGMVFYDIPYYTKLSNIYDLNFTYTEERCQRLYDYLINNCKRYKKCEIWSIWLANCATKRSFKNSAAYIQSWLRVLKNDIKFIVSASSKAEKAPESGSWPFPCSRWEESRIQVRRSEPRSRW